MSGKSVAARAANIKQRQKIAHAGDYWKRLEESRKDKEGKPLPSPEINTQITQCKQCGHKAWFNFLRCPSCLSLQ